MKSVSAPAGKRYPLRPGRAFFVLARTGWTTPLQPAVKEPSVVVPEVGDGFGDRAEAYLHSEVHREGSDLETIAGWVGERDGVLDVASGPGHVARRLIRAGCTRVMALDPEPNMARLARSVEENMAVTVGRAESLPFSAASFSALTCRVAAHHFGDVGVFLRESVRVLEAGGTLVLVDTVAPEKRELDRWINRVERWRDPSHVRSYRPGEWKRRIRAAGLVVRDVRRSSRRLDYDAWIARQNPSPDRRECLRKAFVEASESVRGTFGIRARGGEVESFELPRLLVRASVGGT